MVQTCAICNHLIQDGDRVGVWVTATYHVLKSTVAYALDKTDMEADSSSLIHESCASTEGKENA